MQGQEEAGGVPSSDAKKGAHPGHLTTNLLLLRPRPAAVPVTSSNKRRHAAVAAPLPAQAHARTLFWQRSRRNTPCPLASLYVSFLIENDYICGKAFYMENDIQALTELVKAFVDERDWDQFHNPKDLALALSIEASELNEAFLWKRAEDAKPEKVREELADVFIYALLLARKYGFDVSIIVKEKIAANAAKYPVEKSKGTAKKYNEL